MQVIWLSSTDAGHVEKHECTYSGSGKTPLLCAAAAFAALAIAMVVEHTYMLVLVSKSTPMAFVTWDPDSDPAKSLTWQAGFFFVTTWYKLIFCNNINSSLCTKIRRLGTSKLDNGK